MPTIPCQAVVNCTPCFDEPISNLSNESPDQDRFISRFAFLNNIPPIRQYPDFDAEGGGIFLQVGCMRWCWSTISQADADDCAARQAVECAFDPLIPGFPIPTPFSPNRIQLFYNQAVIGKYTCPDGTMFFYTIPANQIAGVSQGQINAVALSLANERARRHRICLSNLDDPICVNTFYTNQIVATGPYVATFPATDRWELVGGAVPPGMTLETGFTSDGITFSGVPTATGQYSFTVRCTISTFGSPGFGDFMEKTFTINIVGIFDTDPLPDATLGSPYSQQLTAAGSTAPAEEIWSITSGNLPPGLSISTSGLISGTPTGGLAGYSFIAEAIFTVGNRTAVCSKPLTITTTAVGLLAYWAFEDAPPDYDDSTGNGNTLLHFAGDAPQVAAGKIGNGARLTSNDPPFIGSETILRQAVFVGTPSSPNGWTVFGWNNDAFANVTSLAIIQVAAQGGLSSLIMSLVTPPFGVQRFQLDLLSSGPLVTDSVQSQLLASGDNFFVFWWDATTGVASLQVNDGAVFNVPTTWIPSPLEPINNPVLFGANGENAAIISFRVMDETGIVPKVLTAAQRTAMWNGGAGVTWPQVQTIVQS